jgi:hypothetical protein
MTKFPGQKFLMRQSLLQKAVPVLESLFRPLPLNRYPKYVGKTPYEDQVCFREAPLNRTVCLKNTIAFIANLN